MPALLDRFRSAGIRFEAIAEGELCARGLLTDELPAAIRAHKAAILIELANAANEHPWREQPDGADRRDKTPARSAVNPTLKRAFVLERADPMILGVPIRGIGYGELEVRAARCDPRGLLVLFEEHDQPADGGIIRLSF